MIYFAVLRCIDLEASKVEVLWRGVRGMNRKYMYKAYIRTRDGKYVQYATFQVIVPSHEMRVDDLNSDKASDISSVFSMHFVGVLQVVCALILFDVRDEAPQ